MASRMYIAAAVCLLASGLFVAGASATVAFAEPGAGQSGEGDGTQVSGSRVSESQGGESRGGGAAQAQDAASEESPNEPPATRSSEPVEVAAGASDPMRRSADRRVDRAAVDADDTRPDLTASKQLEMDRVAPSQPSSALAGEPAEAAGADPEEHVPGVGWPWWGPCPGPYDPDDPGLPPGNGGGGGGGSGGPRPPNGRPVIPPPVELPRPGRSLPELPDISGHPVVNAATGPAAAAELPFMPITVPVIVAPLGVGGAGFGSSAANGPQAGTPRTSRPPGAPQNSQAAPKDGQQTPAFNASTGTPSASFRAGYGNYLRTADIGEMLAIATPGVAGILVLTGAGGLLGYRQAKAGRAVRAGGTARFVG